MPMSTSVNEPSMYTLVITASQQQKPIEYHMYLPSNAILVF